MESVVRCGQRNHFWQWLYTMYNEFQFWEWLWHCDTTITLNFDTYVISFNYMWSGLNPYKSRVISIFYHKNGPVWLNLFAIHTYNYYSTRLLLVSNLGRRYFAVYCSPVRRWFLASDWCVPVGTVVIMVWIELSVSKQAKFNLVAHKWSKDF